ncbi:MAG: addiction module protein [Gammaproteobacteria bacterium]
MATKYQEIPLEERIRFVEDLWDSIAADQNALPLTKEQEIELKQRLNAYATDRDLGRKADEVITGIRRRI